MGNKIYAGLESNRKKEDNLKKYIDKLLEREQERKNMKDKKEFTKALEIPNDQKRKRQKGGLGFRSIALTRPFNEKKVKIDKIRLLQAYSQKTFL